MIKMSIDVDFTGLDYLQRGGPLRKALRIALNRVASFVKYSLAAEAAGHARRGYLKGSYRIKVILHKSKKVSVIVGPVRKYTRRRGKYSRDGSVHKKGEPRIFRPARYSHRVEKLYHITARVSKQYERWFPEQCNIEMKKEIAKIGRNIKRKK